MTNLFKKNYLKVPHIPFSNAFREVTRNAFVDWLLILFVNVLVLSLTILGGVYLYWQVSTGNFAITKTTIKPEKKTFDEKDLAGIMSQFQTRGDNISAIRSGYKGVIDPSI